MILTRVDKWTVCRRYYMDVNQYCADTLTDIVIEGRRAPNNENFRKPFENVGVVSINHIPTLNLKNVVNWFPNLRYLNTTHKQIGETAIDCCFPLLEHLTINISYSRTHENVTKFLQANPQLQSLYLSTDSSTKITLNELLNMISENKSISKLKIDGRSVDTNMIELKRLINEHPMIIVLALQNCQLSADDVVVFLGQLNSLKEFQFHVKDLSECARLLDQLGNEWAYYADFRNWTNKFHITIAQMKN